jgi:cell division protein FtsQ
MERGSGAVVPDDVPPGPVAPDPDSQGREDAPGPAGLGHGPGTGEGRAGGGPVPTADPDGPARPDRAPGPDPDPGGSAVHPRLWQRRVAVLREQGRRRLRWVVAGVVVLVLACVAMLVLHTPLVAVRSTSVSGAGHTGVGAVLAAAGLTGHPPLIDVDPPAAAAAVERLPWVAHAVVVRRWPDAVSVTVTERVPLGAVPLEGGGVALVDATGHVLAWERSAPAGLVLSVPVAPGPPGTVLAPADRPALHVGAALTGSLAGRVSSVTAGANGTVVLGLGRGLTAELGTPADLGAKLDAVASVLAEADPRGPALIDVTIPDQPTVGPPPPAPRARPGGR